MGQKCAENRHGGMAAEGPEAAPAVFTLSRTLNTLPTMGKAEQAQTMHPKGDSQLAAPQAAALEPAAAHPMKARREAGSTVPSRGNWVGKHCW